MPRAEGLQARLFSDHGGAEVHGGIYQLPFARQLTTLVQAGMSSDVERRRRESSDVFAGR
ncbi:hypothetical protein CGL56_15965 [Neolewinella marina]|uniref:Uncharacterized protein n=1 Tax=Neolewinella marina TaxID=438751 RepID=A0A2G0CBG3_9BACT|nr:hypothetical protein CGL56_15965 [Neolewinella marina]